MNREYDGDPLDQTWRDFEDRPFGGEGETVEVVGGTDDHPTPPQVDVPEDIHLTDQQFEVLQEACQRSKFTIPKLCDAIGRSRNRRFFDQLQDWDVIEKTGETVDWADEYVTHPGSVDDLVRDDWEWLPAEEHALKIAPNHRRCLIYGLRHPKNSQKEIATELDLPQTVVSTAFSKYGDPRSERDVEERLEPIFISQKARERLKEYKVSRGISFGEAILELLD